MAFGALCFLFYSVIVQTKLDWYVLPVYPVVSICIGGAVSLLVSKWQQLAIFLMAGLVVAILMLVAVPQVRLKVLNFAANSYGNFR